MNELINLVWVAVCALLVFFMQAGFAMNECGTCRAKNAVSSIIKNYTDMCFGALAFCLVGYGLMYGASSGGWLGEFKLIPADLSGLNAVNLAYNVLLAGIAATIVGGALAERTHYSAYIVCSVVMTALIYPVFGHWAWHPQGWLKELGFIDFAGATVVHSVGAWCALAGVIALGPRLGRFGKNSEIRVIPAHNLPMVALGGFILWLGWFGVNGGNVGNLENGVLGRVLLNTHLGGCAGAVAALVFMKLTRRPVLLSATVTGSLAGLASISAGAATMDAGSAIVSGLIGGVLCVVSADLLRRIQFDDVVDAIAVHGVGGAWGTLAAGIFYLPDPFNADRIAYQVIGIGTAFLWTLLVSLLMFKLVDQFLGLRSSSINEQRGLDYTEHHELGYPEFQNAPGQMKKEA